MTDSKDADKANSSRVSGPRLGFFEKGYVKDPNKSTLENTKEYLKHLNEQCEQFIKSMNGTSVLLKLNFILKEIPKRFKAFEPYKDGYDLADDILGITVFPALGTAYALATTCIAIYAAAQALYIHSRYGKEGAEEVQKLKDSAVNTLVDAAMIFVAVVAVKLISTLNLLTKTFATALSYMAESKKAPDDPDTGNGASLSKP